jgi:transposase
LLLEDASQPILARLRELMDDLYREWESLCARIEAMNAEFDSLSRRDPIARRLRTIPGIGAITASALACKGIDPSTYPCARQFAASFGLVPNQKSTGGKTRLGAISRRGDRYLRKLAVSGAQAAIRVVRPDATDPHAKRVLRWKARHGTKGAAIRLANRNLRIVWVVMKKAVEFSQHPEAVD